MLLSELYGAARAAMWRRPPAWWNTLRLKLQRDEQPPYLSDEAGFDYPDVAEAAEGELPTFNKLRVLVADDGPAINGGTLALSSDDDDSLLERDTPAPPSRSEPCDSCRQQREKRKERTVKKRLGLAAVLYFLFMVAELLGERLS